MDKVYPDIVQPEAFRDNPSRSCPDLYTKNRKPTDVCFFTVFATFFTVLFCFIGYCVYFGDINRIIHGYDNCGTVCGKTREILDDTRLKQCYKDTTSFGPSHIAVKDGKNINSFCTDNCGKYRNYSKIFNRCLPDKQEALTMIDQMKYFFVAVSEDFELYWVELTQLCLLSLVLSMAILILFQYCVGFIVWIVLMGFELACIFAAVSFWILWVHKKSTPDKYHVQANLWLYFGLAIGTTVLSVVTGAVIVFMRKKIDLVVQLFKEAGKAIGSMPGLLLEPIVTFSAVAATIVFGIYFTLWIGSAGHLVETLGRSNIFHFHKDGLMKATAVLNIIGMLWMYQFIVGCQHMIVAGAVSKWYFTRDKSKLPTPIAKSAYNLIRYHLGSVAVGSVLSDIVEVLSMLVRFLHKEDGNPAWGTCSHLIIKCCLCYCSACLAFFKYLQHILGRPAYALVAMYGHSFFKAGKTAFANIVAHPFSIAAINSVGDFVLFLAKVLVVIVTEAAASYLLKEKGLQYMWVALTVIGIFSICISHCFVTVYEMIIDTIFMCYCEDFRLNDGVSKPYYMSKGLMEFVENSKTGLEEHNQRKLYEHQKSRFTGKEFVVHSTSAPPEMNNDTIRI